jgi:tRNA pseudouridine55 synthase
MSDGTYHGWLNAYKPRGISSNHYLSRVRRVFGKGTKVGHAGTLDPLADGLLPVAVGSATRLIPFCMDASKAYVFTVAWGASTDTYDAEGAVTARSCRRPSRAEISAALPALSGEISQVPPVFSAVKRGGRRACDLAREGVVLDMAPRRVRIYGFRLLEAGEDEAELLVYCSKGTYVRSLARDLCVLLGAEGHVARLTRVKAGFFSLDDAFLVAKNAGTAYKHVLAGHLKPADTVLDDIPVLYVSQAEAADLRLGKSIAAPNPLGSEGADLSHARAALKCGRALVALAELRESRLRPRRVFNM